MKDDRNQIAEDVLTGFAIEIIDRVGTRLDERLQQSEGRLIREHVDIILRSSAAKLRQQAAELRAANGRRKSTVKTA
jgi:hypothetical protein